MLETDLRVSRVFGLGFFFAESGLQCIRKGGSKKQRGQDSELTLMMRNAHLHSVLDLCYAAYIIIKYSYFEICAT